MNVVEERRYTSDLSVEQLSDAVRQLWREIQANPDSPIAEEAREYNIAAVPNVDVGELIEIRRESAGMGSAETTIVVTLAAKMVKDLWDYVILPRIRQRWGDQSAAVIKT